MQVAIDILEQELKNLYYVKIIKFCGKNVGFAL